MPFHSKDKAMLDCLILHFLKQTLQVNKAMAISRKLPPSICMLQTRNTDAMLADYAKRMLGQYYYVLQ